MITPSDLNDVKPGAPSDSIPSTTRRGPEGERPPIETGLVPIGLERENDIPEPIRSVFVGTVISWSTGAPVIVTVMRQDGLQIKAYLFDQRAELEVGMVVALVRIRKPKEEAVIEGEPNINYIIPDALMQRASWGLAYASQDVTTGDSTFTADLFNSYPKPLGRDDNKLPIQVVNPETADGSGVYKHSFSTNDVVVVAQWLKDQWIVIGGVNNTPTNYSMIFSGTLASAITSSTSSVTVNVTWSDHPGITVPANVVVSNFCKHAADLGANVICTGDEGLVTKYILNLECP